MSGLVGCFEIPATRAYQVNGKPRPEGLIGNDASKNQIILGETNLADALVILRRETEGSRPYHEYGYSMAPLGRGFDDSWLLSRDGRLAVVDYEVRVGTQIWPLCFSVTPDGERRQLVLRLDERGTVVGSQTYSYEEFTNAITAELVGAQNAQSRDLAALDPTTRARLVEAKLLPYEATLAAKEHQMQQRRTPSATTTTHASTEPTR